MRRSIGSAGFTRFGNDRSCSTAALSTRDGDTTRVVLPLRFTWTGANAAARAALNYGEIPYTMQGQVRLDTPIGVRVVPFTRSGRAPLSRGG